MDDNVNIILSSEFYWVRIFDLPMNSKKEVLSILPSLFEDFIDISNKKFYVKKLEDNRYLCFAYDEEQIVESIKKSNLLVNQVLKVYFSQIEFMSEQGNIVVDNLNFSYIDDILVKVPSQVNVEYSLTLDVNTLNLSNETITVSSSSKYISSSNSYILSGIFAIFAILLFMKSIQNSYLSSTKLEETENIHIKYNMPSSTMQVNSIIKNLNKISKKQIEVRRAYKYIFDIKNIHAVKMLSCDYKNNQFIVKYKGIGKKEVTQYINKQYSALNIQEENKVVTVGFKI